VKTGVKHPFTRLVAASARSRVLPALMAGFGLMLAGQLPAQTFTILHSFTAGPGSFPDVTNSDGANPIAGLILASNTLYGTAYSGGSSGSGTVFQLNTDGTGFITLRSFTAPSGTSFGPNPRIGSNSDGAYPSAGLILSGHTLYGTAPHGGTSSNGTVFAVNTDGTGFTTLHEFNGPSDGAFPVGGLIVSSNTLYGTTYSGGGSSNGTVFELNTDGTGFAIIHTFTGPSDGAGPGGGLTLSSNTLYGTTYSGGGSGAGTVFAVNTDGTGFAVLHAFTATSGYPGTNSDGAGPEAGLVQSGNTLYGTAGGGGSSGYGAVFAVNTDGTGFTTLHAFTASSAPLGTNSDGAFPSATLILSGGTLFGTAVLGGTWDNGTVFAVNTDGSGFTTLHSFTGGSDGGIPYSGLILSGDTLYGTASSYGSSSGAGTVFSISLAPQLTITPSGSNVILTWPTNLAGFSYAGFAVRSTASLSPPVVWSPVSNSPAFVNGQHAVTNPISGAQQFYRLSQ
jgi:uncharacterized repeat protein (TIGR03803 family)